MKSRLLTLIALPALFLPLSACMQGNSDMINERMAQQDRRIEALSNQAREVEQVLPGQAEMWAQMQSMRQEMATIHGQLDDLNNRSAQIGDAGQLRADVARLDAAVRQMAAQLGVEVDGLRGPAVSPAPAVVNPYTGTPVSAAPPVESAPEPVNIDTAKALYDSGTKAFGDRRYRDAIKIFDDFSANYAKHQLAGNSQFWRGESYFQLGDYANAALAYQEVISKYPASQKLQGAYLKQGMAFYKAGKKDAGKVRFDELIKKYPNSPEAVSAKKFMAANK